MKSNKRKIFDYNPENLYSNGFIILKKKKNYSRIIMRVVIIFILCVMAAIVVLPVVSLKKFFDDHGKKLELNIPEGFEGKELTIKTNDGVNLNSCEVYTEAPYAVVVLPLCNNDISNEVYFQYAELFKESGYASFICETREEVSLGYKEHIDVEGVIDYIHKQEKYYDTPIVVYGMSMAGPAAINAMGENKSVAGVIATGTYSSWEDNYSDYLKSKGMPSFIADMEKYVSKVCLAFKYGTDIFEKTPVKEIEKRKGRPVLLIHSNVDNKVSYDNLSRLKDAGGDIDTYTIEEEYPHIVDNNHRLVDDNSGYVGEVFKFLDKNFAAESK